MPRSKKVEVKNIFKVSITGKNEILSLVMKDHDYDEALNKGRELWKLIDSPIYITIHSNEGLVYKEQFSHLKRR